MTRHISTKSLSISLIAALAASLPMSVPATSLASGAPKLVRSARAVPGHYIVRFEDSDGKAAVDAAELSAEIAAVNALTLDRVYASTIRGFAAEMTEEEALWIARDPRVAEVL